MFSLVMRFWPIVGLALLILAAVVWLPPSGEQTVDTQPNAPPTICEVMGYAWDSDDCAFLEMATLEKEGWETDRWESR